LTIRGSRPTFHFIGWRALRTLSSRLFCRGPLPMPNFSWFFVPSSRPDDGDDVPGLHMMAGALAGQSSGGDVKYFPGLQVDLGESTGRPTSDYGAASTPVAYRPLMPLPKIEGNPGPSLHPPGRYRQFAPGFPWEWDPDPPALPSPPPFGRPEFRPPQYQPLPPDQRPPYPWPDGPWPPWPPRRQP